MKFAMDKCKIMHLRWNNHASCAMIQTWGSPARVQLCNTEVRKYQPAIFLDQNYNYFFLGLYEQNTWENYDTPLLRFCLSLCSYQIQFTVSQHGNDTCNLEGWSLDSGSGALTYEEMLWDQDLEQRQLQCT